MNNISILNSSINTKYSIKNQIVIFQSDGSKNFNSKINYNGQLAINPFDLNLKIDLYNYKISNLFRRILLLMNLLNQVYCLMKIFLYTL